MFNRKEFGAAIRNARLAKKYTQEKLAEILGVTPVHVKQIEAGTRLPSVKVLYCIAAALSFSVDEGFFPVKSTDKELLCKVKRLLRTCTTHDLHVVYATASALKDEYTEH